MMEWPKPVSILDADACQHQDVKWSHLSNHGGVSHNSYVGTAPDHRLDLRFEQALKKRGFSRIPRRVNECV